MMKSLSLVSTSYGGVGGYQAYCVCTGHNMRLFYDDCSLGENMNEFQFGVGGIRSQDPYLTTRDLTN